MGALRQDRLAWRRRRGLALVLVLILVAVATVISMSCLYSTTLQVAVGENLGRVSRAKYLAESGIQHAMYLLQTDLATMEKTSQASPLGPYYADGSDDSYTIYCVKLSTGKYQLCATAACDAARQTTLVTVTREPAAQVTTPATASMGDSVLLGSFLTVQGNVHTNGSLSNRAYVYGNASACGTLSDPYSRITGTKTSQAPNRTIPEFRWSDFLTYTFYTQQYKAAATELLKNFDNMHSLAMGRAITSTNPGGIVYLRPLDGTLVELSDLTMKGTLVIDGDLLIKTTASIEAVKGYPAIVCSGKIRIRNGATVAISGLVKADQGIWPESGTPTVNVSVTGGIISNTGGYHLDIRGSNVLRQSSERATVYDFQCRNSLPKVAVLSWDD